MTYLPDDIWYLVCTQLWQQRDFNTLFNCACAGKQLATIALMNLYRMQGVVPSEKSNGPDVFYLSPAPSYAKRLARESILMKCAGLWRTIILSSLGKTSYPYSQYIRMLNLGALEELLRKCSSETEELFFHGELAQFKGQYTAAFPAEYREIVDGRPRRCIMETINKIGDVITKKTPLLEELTAKVLSETLSQWIPRLNRLTHLKPWNGQALINGNGTLVRLHCPSFKKLEIWNWDSYLSKVGVAAFLNELCPQSLESFETLSCCGFGLESFQALSCHRESLIELKLHCLDSYDMPNVSMLKGCTNLVSLSLVGDAQGEWDFEKGHNDLFLEMAAWLKDCKKLRNLAFTKFFSAPALMTPILLDYSIHLTSLKYKGIVMRDTEKFHQALANQTNLQSLWLEGAPEWWASDGSTNLRDHRLWLKGAMDKCVLDTDILVESLSKLVDLRNLHLLWITNSFCDRHIMQLASSLPKLEVWLTSGNWLTDAIWGEVATLRSLQRLDLRALTRFTADGILNFIEKIGPGNKGLALSVRNTEEIPWAKKELIQETIANKFEGTFNFTLISDSDPSESAPDWYDGEPNLSDGESE